MICVYNRPNDHNATIVRCIGCMKSTGYTRICVVTQNVHKNTKLQDHQNKQNGWLLCLHFRNKSAEGIELKNSVKESFRPIDRSL